MDNPGIYPTYLHHREILFFFASAKPEKITEMIIEGLFTGLSVGASCLSSCGPLIMSVIMKNAPSASRAYAWLGKFLAGRLAAYMAVAVVIARLGGAMPISRGAMATATLLAGLMMLANAFARISPRCAKGQGVKDFMRRHFRRCYVAALGFISALNICPPVIAAATLAASAGSAAGSMAAFALFFVGSSAYMLPLPLISLASNKEAVQTIGKFASAIVGAVLIAKAILIFID